MLAALKALAEPNRLRILRLLRSRELSAGEIASRFHVTRPAISQHLSVLRGAGLIVEKRDGTKRIYRIRPEGLAGLRTYLGQIWDDGLDELRREAEAMERRGRRR